MSSVQVYKYYCDNCREQLPTSHNNVAIVTAKSESNIGWKRLIVTIQLHHGSYNDGKFDKADLCKKCTITLLQDALDRVKAGERVSAGVSSTNQLGFDED